MTTPHSAAAPSRAAMKRAHTLVANLILWELTTAEGNDMNASCDEFGYHPMRAALETLERSHRVRGDDWVDGAAR